MTRVNLNINDGHATLSTPYGDTVDAGRTFECDYCGKVTPWKFLREIINRRPSDGTWCAIMWVCPSEGVGIKPDDWCEDMGPHDGPVCPFCGIEPEVCACGDNEWGGCGKDTCHSQYEQESNAV